MKLDKNKIYDLSGLTREELDQLLKHMQENYDWVSNDIHTDLFFEVGEGWLYNKVDKVSNMTNAKELFYTLENIQVDCRYLTPEQINEMADVYKNNGFRIGSLYLSSDYYFLNDNNCNYCLVNTYLKNKTIITYEKFMELFGNKEKSEEFKNLVEVSNEELTEEACKETDNKLNYELDFNFITQLAERMAQNKHKYEPYNWQKLDNIAELKQALFRHVMEVMNGNYEDDGRMFGHLESIALNAMFINYQLNNLNNK